VIKKIVFSGLVIVLMSFSMHKYFVSISEANYNAASQTFEVSIKFIGHDLEKALSEGGVPALYLGTEKEDSKANEYLQKYIEKKMHFVADGKSLAFHFIGKEINNDDFIYCFIESEPITNPTKITIKNTLLMELFPEQKNAVYLTIGDKQLNYSLDKNKVSETHQIQE
jgi:uncharacterized protein YlxP (DUF503 family)